LKKRGQWKAGDRVSGLRKTKPDACVSGLLSGRQCFTACLFCFWGPSE
jgi:hypothetical protein